MNYKEWEITLAPLTMGANDQVAVAAWKAHLKRRPPDEDLFHMVAVPVYTSTLAPELGLRGINIFLKHLVEGLEMICLKIEEDPRWPG